MFFLKHGVDKGLDYFKVSLLCFLSISSQFINHATDSRNACTLWTLINGNNVE